MSSASISSTTTPARAASNTVAIVANSASNLVAQTPKTVSSALQTVKQQTLLSTPQSKPQQPPLPPPSPGTFRHPQLTEIIRRQSKSYFNERNVQNILINTTAIIFSVVCNGYIKNSINSILRITDIPNTTLYVSYALNLLRLVFILNIIFSLRPVIPYIASKDEMSDIPLTPSQRSLLGLDPSITSTSSPATGRAANTTTNTNFITPPRYRRSSGSSGTPQSSFNSSGDSRPSTDRRSISANYSSSPQSTSRYTLGFSPSPAATGAAGFSSTFRRTASGSPFSASPAASPLFHKAISHSQQNQQQQQQPLLDAEIGGFGGGIGGSGERRSSFGPTSNSTNSNSNSSSNTSGFGLDRSQSVRERGSYGRENKESGFGTSSSGLGNRSPAGLNYKWLYDKGGRLPRSESMGF